MVCLGLVIFYYGLAVPDGKVDCVPCIVQPVCAPGVVLVVWAGVVLEHLGDKVPVVGGKVGVCGSCMVGENDWQRGDGECVGPSACGVCVVVGKGEVGLDVYDGGAVDEVCSVYVEYGAVGGVMVYPVKAYAAEADIVGAEGGARCKNSHASVAAKKGGTDGESLAADVEGPQEPYMAEGVEAAQGFLAAVAWLEDYA